jgi:hypothetical protein
VGVQHAKLQAAVLHTLMSTFPEKAARPRTREGATRKISRRPLRTRHGQRT